MAAGILRDMMAEKKPRLRMDGPRVGRTARLEELAFQQREALAEIRKSTVKAKLALLDNDRVVLGRMLLKIEKLAGGEE